MMASITDFMDEEDAEEDTEETGNQRIRMAQRMRLQSRMRWRKVREI